MMASLSGRIQRYLTIAVCFTLLAIVLLFLTADFGPHHFSHPKPPRPPPPPLKCAPPRPPERPWQEFEAAPPGNNSPLPSAPAWEFVVSRDANNYGLSREQCNAAFPKLFVEIDKAVKEREGRNITFEEIDGRDMGNGEVRALLHDGQVCFGCFTQSFALAS